MTAVKIACGVPGAESVGTRWHGTVGAVAAAPHEDYRGGSVVRHRVHGEGEPILLLHGLGGCGLDWSLQVPALERRFRVLVPDLPGCGSSLPPGGAYSIARVASTLWSWLEQLDLPQISIVGFSMGGAIALEMAIQRPALVPRLVLINSLATYRDRWRKWLCARRCCALVRLVGMRRAARIFAAGLFPEPWQQTFRDRAEAVVAAVPTGTYLSMLRALECWDATDRLHRVQSRTLVIAAEHDYTPLEEKRMLAARLAASLVVVHGSHHGTPFDASEATNSSLLAFLGDRPLPPYEQLLCDTPTRSQAEFMRVRSRVLELLENTGVSPLPKRAGLDRQRCV
ncbi:MAG TPA: alpha/beta hydrolase [Burkholderiales bacterium]|nr:alpha/beta hydrolase [Burkholderiales bacterium]